MATSMVPRRGPTLARVKEGCRDVRLALRQRALQLGRDALERLARIVDNPKTSARDATAAAGIILRAAGLMIEGHHEDESARDRFRELIVALRTPTADSVRSTGDAIHADPPQASDVSRSSPDDDQAGGGGTRSAAQSHDDLDASTHFSPVENGFESGMERVIDIDEDGSVVKAEDVYVATRVDDGVRIVSL